MTLNNNLRAVLKSKNTRTVRDNKVVRVKLDIPWVEVQGNDIELDNVMEWLDVNVGSEIDFGVGPFIDEGQEEIGDFSNSNVEEVEGDHSLPPHWPMPVLPLGQFDRVSFDDTEWGVIGRDDHSYRVVEKSESQYGTPVENEVSLTVAQLSDMVVDADKIVIEKE